MWRSAMLRVCVAIGIVLVSFGIGIYLQPEAWWRLLAITVFMVAFLYALYRLVTWDA